MNVTFYYGNETGRSGISSFPFPRISPLPIYLGERRQVTDAVVLPSDCGILIEFSNVFVFTKPANADVLLVFTTLYTNFNSPLTVPAIISDKN